MSNSGYAAVLAMVALLVAIVFGVAYYGDLFPKNSSSTTNSTTSSTAGTTNLEVYQVVYSGSGAATDSNNPIPIEPNEQCGADYPCDAFLNDSASWNWSYVYYYLFQPGVGGYLTAYDMDATTETMTYSANWVAIPAQNDPAYSCSGSSSTISNPNYYQPNMGAVLGFTGGVTSQAIANSTEYAPWNAIIFTCGTYNKEPALSTPSCASSYTGTFSFTLAPGTYPETGSLNCPSAEPQGAGGYAGGTFSWTGSVAVSQGTCNNIPSSTQMVSLLKDCLAGTLP